MRCTAILSNRLLVTRIMPLRKLSVFLIIVINVFCIPNWPLTGTKKLFYFKFLCISFNLHINFCPFFYFFLVNCSRQILSDKGDGANPTGTPSSGVMLLGNRTLLRNSCCAGFSLGTPHTDLDVMICPMAVRACFSGQGDIRLTRLFIDGVRVIGYTKLFRLTSMYKTIWISPRPVINEVKDASCNKHPSSKFSWETMVYFGAKNRSRIQGAGTEDSRACCF